MLPHWSRSRPISVVGFHQNVRSFLIWPTSNSQPSIKFHPEFPHGSRRLSVLLMPRVKSHLSRYAGEKALETQITDPPRNYSYSSPNIPSMYMCCRLVCTRVGVRGHAQSWMLFKNEFVNVIDNRLHLLKVFSSLLRVLGFFQFAGQLLKFLSKAVELQSSAIEHGLGQVS
jgi:hypothetical protein